MEMAGLGSPSLIFFMASVDVKQHLKMFRRETHLVFVLTSVGDSFSRPFVFKVDPVLYSLSSTSSAPPPPPPTHTHIFCLCYSLDRSIVNTRRLSIVPLRTHAPPPPPPAPLPVYMSLSACACLSFRPQITLGGSGDSKIQKLSLSSPPPLSLFILK